MFLNQILHNLLHVLLPLALALFVYKPEWKRSYLIIISAYLIDLDHLFADPIFDPSRCSIGLHPLHSYFAIFCYILLTVYPKTRIIGLGLIIHIFVDLTDCARIYFN